MKNILIVPYSHQLGSTHTLIQIGIILRKAGFNVIFAGEGEYLKFAKDYKFKIIKLSEIPIDKYREQTDKAQFDYLSIKEINEFVDEEIKLINDNKIDLIIDTIRPTHFISSKITGVRRISLNYAILLKDYALKRKIPESHFLDFFKHFPPIYYLLNKLGVLVLRLVYKKYSKNYKKVMLSRKVQFDNNIDWEDLISGYETFIYDIPEFAPIKNLSNEIRKREYIGTPLLDIPVENPPWIQNIHQLKKDGFKIIYLSMGTTGKMLENIFKHLEEYISDKKYALICNTTNLAQLNKSSYANNIFQSKYLPANTILKLSDLMITHGGRGSIYHALINGVPIIGIPHQGEQEWNLLRCQELGLGQIVSKKYYHQKKLIQAIEFIFNDHEKYKMRCKLFGEKVISFPTEKVILDFIGKEV